MSLSKNEKMAIDERAFDEAVQSRGGGTWAGGGFGLAVGTGVGAVIAMVPVVFFGAPFALATVAGTAALCGGIGALQGKSGGSENGSSAGAAAYAVKALTTEMRNQFHEIRQEIAELKGLPKEECKSVSMELADKNVYTNHKITPQETSKGWFYVKTGLTALALGAIGGAVVGLAAQTGIGEPVMKALTNIGFSSPVQQMVGSILLGAASMSLFLFNVPLISSKLHMVARDFISGRAFGAEPKLHIKQELPDVSRPNTPDAPAHAQDTLIKDTERVFLATIIAQNKPADYRQLIEQQPDQPIILH